MSVVYRTNGTDFYGLVTQKGPGRVNAADMDRFKRSAAGGEATLHAGHGAFKDVIQPNSTMDTRKPPPTMSKFVQRSVMYKPLIYNATTAVPGRAEILERNRKGFPMGKGPDPVQPRAAPKNKAEYDAMRLEENPNYVPVKEYPKGTIGSAPTGSDIPTDAIIHPGRTVGDILWDASGKLVKGTALASGVPVIGPVAGALGGLGAAALGAAGGIADGIEKSDTNTFDDNYYNAIGVRDNLNRAAGHLNTIVEGDPYLNYKNSPINGPGVPSTRGGTSFYTGDDRTRYEGSNFSSTFSGYQPGVTLKVGSESFKSSSRGSGSTKSSSSSKASTQSMIKSWLKEVDLPASSVGGSDYGSLEEFRSELDELIQKEEDAEMRARLAALMDRATRGTQTDFGALSGAATQTEDVNPVVKSAGPNSEIGRARMADSSTMTEARINPRGMGTQTDEGPTMMDSSTQAREVSEVVAALEAQIDLLVDNEGQAAQQWKSISEYSVRWLNILGLDTQAIQMEMNRKNPDIETLQALIQEAVDTVRQRVGPVPKEISDSWTMTEDNIAEQTGYISKGTFVPPRPDLITQAKRQMKRKGDNLESGRVKRQYGRNEDDTQFGKSWVGAGGQMPGEKGGKDPVGLTYKNPVRRYVDRGTSTQTPSTPLKTPNTRSKAKKK